MTTESFAITPTSFAASDLFERTFDEGMTLVEETAAYLEGPGRQAAKDLTREGALAYAGESMRLTTRLMQIASWLLVHRAVKNGEMTDEDACAERFRMKDADATDPRSVEARGELPERLNSLIGRAEALFDRVCRLDARLFETHAPAKPGVNPVAKQIAHLYAAFNSEQQG